MKLPTAIPGVNCAAVVELKETIQHRRPVPIERIIWNVCEYVGVSVQDMASRSRVDKLVATRQMISVLAREMTPLSYPEIAKAMGRVNVKGKPKHTSVLTMKKAWKKRVRDAAYDQSEYVNTTTGTLKPENALQEVRNRIERTAA